MNPVKMFLKRISCIKLSCSYAQEKIMNKLCTKIEKKKQIFVKLIHFLLR